MTTDLVLLLLGSGAIEFPNADISQREYEKMVIQKTKYFGRIVLDDSTEIIRGQADLIYTAVRVKQELLEKARKEVNNRSVEARNLMDKM